MGEQNSNGQCQVAAFAAKPKSGLRGRLKTELRPSGPEACCPPGPGSGPPTRASLADPVDFQGVFFPRAWTSVPVVCTKPCSYGRAVAVQS